MKKLKFDSKLHEELYKDLQSLMIKDITSKTTELEKFTVVESTPETSGYEWLLFSAVAVGLVGLVYKGIHLVLNGPLTSTGILKAMK